MFRSRAVAATFRPSAEKAISRIVLDEASRDPICMCVVESQNGIKPTPPLASTLPSGEKARAETHPACSMAGGNSRGRLGVDRSQKRTYLSIPLVAMMERSGENTARNVSYPCFNKAIWWKEFV